MTERACKFSATLIGAAVGAIVGYVLLTDEGRVLRRRLDPAIDDVAAELVRFRATIQRAANVASEGWQLLNETLEGGRPEPLRYGDPHQTTPF